MAELGSELPTSDSVWFFLGPIPLLLGTREVGEGHSGVGGWEEEGDEAGPTSLSLKPSSC